MEHGLLFHEEAAFYQEIMHIPLVVAYAPGVTQGANIDRLISNRQAFHLVVDAAEGRLPPEKFFARLNELTADEALADDGVDNIGFIRDGRKLIEEFCRGYMAGERLLRPAMVKVART